MIRNEEFELYLRGAWSRLHGDPDEVMPCVSALAHAASIAARNRWVWIALRLNDAQMFAAWAAPEYVCPNAQWRDSAGVNMLMAAQLYAELGEGR